MIVASILRSKGHEIHGIEADASVEEAIRELARHGVGALVVTADVDPLFGVIFERDIVRGLAEEGAGLLSRPVAQVMTRDVTTCAPTDSIDKIMAIMTGRRQRHVPIVDGDQLCGIVSIGDVVKARLDDLELEARMLHDYIQSR
jgi:CBS domain-containing protein